MVYISTRHLSASFMYPFIQTHYRAVFILKCLFRFQSLFTLWGNILSDRSNSFVSWKFNQDNTLNFSLICDACVCELCLKCSYFLVWRYVFVCVGVTFQQVLCYDIQQGSEGSNSPQE